MIKQGSVSKQVLAHPPRRVLLFSIGGRRLAARMEEVVGVTSWSVVVPLKNETPFLSGLVRHDQAVLPVCDLAARLRVSVEGGHPLCLVAKHPLGNMAICIDEVMPIMQTCDTDRLRNYQANDLPAEQSCEVDMEEIPILHMSQLLSH